MRPYASNRHRILIFDSGIGGLSVLRSAHARLPQLHYHYLADNAYWPYGPKPAIEIQQRLMGRRRHDSRLRRALGAVSL